MNRFVKENLRTSSCTIKYKMRASCN